jgi:putative peptidoglycan lipid II flippase
VVDLPEVDLGSGALPLSATPGGRLLRTAGLVTIITSLGSLLGLVRDVLIARFFGASGDTDAFLVAWTLPETATPLLMEGALSFLLVPLLSRELELRGSLQRVVDRTFLPAVIGLAVLAGLTALLAPAFVGTLAPGLANPHLAVRCVRAASFTIFFLGVSGYLMATLRATESFLIPSWVYVAYNTGILALILPLHHRYGVYIAAVGLTVGSACMVVIQLWPFLRRVRLRSLGFRIDRRLIMALGAFVPLGAYTLGRQAQVYVERFFGSELTAGAISHLNYATKIAQIPMTMATTVAMVSFPSLSRHAASGRRNDLRRGVEHNLRLGALLVMPAVAMLIAFAPQIVQVLFQRGAFTATDTASSAGIMRVYSTGLLGQTMVGVATVCFFSLTRKTWYAGIAALVGLVATIVVSWAAVGPLGAPGLALGNAAGITVAAILMLLGIRTRVVDIDVRSVVDATTRCGLAATTAGVAGFGFTRLFGGHLPAVLVLLFGLPVLVLIYVVVGRSLAIPEVIDGLAFARRRYAERWVPSLPGSVGRRLSAYTPEALRSSRRPRPARSAGRTRFLTVAAAALVGGVVAVGAGALLPATYTATATLLVLPGNTDGTLSTTTFTQGAARLVTKQSVVDSALGGPSGVTPQQLRRSVRVTATPDSPLIEIAADAGTSDAAARRCNAVARAAAAALTAHAVDTGFRVDLATEAVPPAYPAAPNTGVDLLAGATLGGLLGIGAAVLGVGRRRRIAPVPLRAADSQPEQHG